MTGQEVVIMADTMLRLMAIEAVRATVWFLLLLPVGALLWWVVTRRRR